ncbi:MULTISPECIES: HNH endonuclease [unclassified Streptomyces]|uniref:HNH endonuclease n=1 Tax=unclassified Streptomyces TaxID=2593676 RepID=UPI001F20433C|nr:MULTISPECIES: HNH endonuclease [unclassified Streptomyces]MCF0087279.1 hypothetical protein [Streptomyces sp. MH192]MCF0099445.1 hypothetical protein [Streptomyces sp. MH191]
MGLGEVTRAGVLAAVEECRDLGREAFLRRYGFGRALTYELVWDGGLYDSKAIAGVAHLYSAGRLLTAADFSGGARTVAHRLRALGFTVEEGTGVGEQPRPVAPQLLLQPRGNARLRGPQNFDRSIRHGIPLTEIDAVLGKHAEPLTALYPDGIARLWGSTPTTQINNEKAKALRNRRPGDDVLFYADNHFIARARILHLFDSTAVARAVWGTDDEDTTWEHVMALGDVEEFERPVFAAPLLSRLDVPSPLRSLTLRNAELHHRVIDLLPTRPRAVSLPSPARPTSALTAKTLLERIGSLHTHRHPGSNEPSRHQPLALLWAASRIAAGKPRLAPWDTFRSEVGPLLAAFGLPGSKVTPEYPFWHLRGSGLWQLHGAPDADGSMPQIGALNAVQPVAGLTQAAADLLTDPLTRLEAVLKLCSTYLDDVDRRQLLDSLGLYGYTTADGLGDTAEDGGQDRERTEAAPGPAERRETLSSRLVRDAAIAKQVKDVHGHACQVCETRLSYRRKPYSEAAHIRGLGTPHNGPDELANLLCLCPNHHVLFDGLEIYVDVDHVVRWTHGGGAVGRLRGHDEHRIDEAYLRYHRTLCELSRPAQQ